MNKIYSIKEIPLPEVIFFQEGPGLRKWQWTEDGMKVINVTNILGDECGTVDITNTDKYISLVEHEEKYKHFSVDLNDIVVASSGNTYGKVGRIREENLPLMMNTSVIRFRSLNEERLCNEFLYCFLRSPSFKNQIEQYVTGGAQPNFGPSHLKRMVIQLPDIEIQRKIGSVISAYDKLMTNNMRRIKLLEETSKLIFNEWFIYLRFPGYEHTRMIEGVPHGWKKVTVPDIIDINPRTKVPKDAENTYIEMASLSSDSMVVSNLQKKWGNSGSKFQNEDTLFARITPCLENGKTCFVNFLKEKETAIGSTEFIVLRPKSVTSEFVYCLSRTYDFRENAIKSMIGSSGRQRVQVSCFEEYHLLQPSESVLAMFNDLVNPAFEEIKLLVKQNQKLQQAREILLPKLMNGGEVNV